METTFELSNTLLNSSMPEALTYADINSSTSVPQDLSHDFSSFLNSQASSSFAQFKETISGLKDKLSTDVSPSNFKDAFAQFFHFDSSNTNEFLRRKTGLSECETLPATTEAKTPPAREFGQDALETQLKQSKMQVSQLVAALSRCEKQIHQFQGTIVESHGIMKELANRWGEEKDRADEMHYQINLLTDLPSNRAQEICAVRAELEGNWREIALYEGNSIGLQTERDSQLDVLRQHNSELTERVKRNVEVFSQFSLTMDKNSETQQELKQRNNEIARVSSEKRATIEMVENTIDLVQQILEGPTGTNREKLTRVIQLLSTMRN